MIAMLVRDYDPVQGLEIFPDRGEPFDDLATTQTCVDENTSPISGDKGGISSATGRQDADLDDGGSSPVRSYR